MTVTPHCQSDIRAWTEAHCLHSNVLQVLERHGVTSTSQLFSIDEYVIYVMVLDMKPVSRRKFLFSLQNYRSITSQLLTFLLDAPSFLLLSGCKEATSPVPMEEDGARNVREEDPHDKRKCRRFSSDEI